MSTTKECEKCGELFDIASPGYLCPQCRKENISESLPERNEMPTITVKEKLCAKCGKKYMPTGNCQKYCSDCAGSKEKKLIKPKPVQAQANMVQNEDSMILKMLIELFRKKRSTRLGRLF
jgi:hypothetical protein